MTGQSPPKYVDSLAVWDTETTVDPATQRHVVNAVGLLYQSRESYDVWMEKYFYSASMHHPKDKTEGPSFQFDPYSRCAFKPLRKAPPDHKSPKVKQLLKAAERAPNLEDPFGTVEDVSALENFISFILSAEFYKTTFIAHYGRGFDMLLLMERLHMRNVEVEPIFQGQKVLLLRLPEFKIRFVDSHLYFHMPLAKLPSRFPQIARVLDAEARDAQKGVFPYKMNTPDYYEYEGEAPPLDLFVDEFASVKKVDEARDFLRRMNGRTYNFKEQLHLYLKADVQVLAAAVCCLLEEFGAFQESLQKDRAEEKIFFCCFSSPFLTLPQFIHCLWRTHALSHTLYLLTNQTLDRNSSYAELEWLDFQRKQRHLQDLRTAQHSSGQMKIGPYYLDGFDAAERVAFEFLGCAVHCHHAVDSQCPLTRGLAPCDGNPFGENPSKVISRFRSKKSFLEDQGLKVDYIWECEWNRAKGNDPRVKEFLDSYLPPPPRLCIRKGLKGGRCEAFRLKFNKRDFPDKSLHYIDINSLYPTVAIFNAYPVGLGETYRGKKLDSLIVDGRGVFSKSDPSLSFLGLVYARVHPPDDLYIPILPTVVNGKLLFGLCQTCMELKHAGPCTHSRRERCVEDVWTVPELCFALSKGYQVDELYEALLYQEKAKIFETFYAKLARMKLVSEPLPEGDLQSHVDLLNAQGPYLDPPLTVEDMKPNSELRAMAKLIQVSSVNIFL